MLILNMKNLMCLLLTSFLLSNYQKFVADMALHKGTLQILENNVGISDAVLLDPMTEDAFIKNIQDRFNHQQIYVSMKNIYYMYIHYNFCVSWNVFILTFDSL